MNIELKDYFAGKAMQVLVSDKSKSIDSVVMTSYHIAEKMIEHKHKHKLINDKYVTLSNRVKLDNVENL